MKAKEKIRVLRAALKRYANKKNWYNDDWDILSVYSNGSDGYGNPTRVAKDALEKTGDNNG